MYESIKSVLYRFSNSVCCFTTRDLTVDKELMIMDKRLHDVQQS